MRHLVFGVSMLLCLSTVPLFAQGAKPEIWGKTIHPQPFDKQPFREIKVPAWLEETVGVGYTLSVQSAAQRERAVKAGVTISEMGFVDPIYVYYDSQYLKRRNPFVAKDSVDKEVAEYRRLGVRILGVYPPTLQGEVWEAHPDWRRIATNTRDIPQADLKVHPYGGMLCLLGPYGDFFVDVMGEIASKFPVDAFSYDGLHYAGVCYCQHCRENYRKETGQEIPNVNLEDPAFRRYQHWADRRMEDVIRRLQVRLKGIRPEIALVTWTTNAGRFGHFQDIPRNMPARMNLLLDAPDQEFWLDETNRGATVVPALANAYVWACTNHRVAFSEPYLMSHGNPYGKDSFPAHEVLRRVLLAATHGASPSLAVIQPEALQPATYAALEEVQRRKEWLTHKSPEPWGAMLLSDNTRVLYGRSPGKVEERYLANVLGSFRAVLEEHLPVTLVCDWNLTPDDIAPYKVLVLPNAACLDDSQVQTIREYVRNGGGLVASLDTSLFNEYGDPRADFALSDVLGVKHAGTIRTEPARTEDLDVNFARTLTDAYWEQRKNAFDLQVTPGSPLGDSRLQALIGKDVVTFKGPAVAVTLVPELVGQPNVLASQIVPKGAPQTTISPAIVTRTFGKGRVVYFPAGLDAALYTYGYPYQRVLLANAIRWAAQGKPPVEVQAPMCVHATVFRQEKPKTSKRLLVHLYNDVNTTAFHGLPENDVPLREETIPIAGIEITFHRTDLRKVTQQPEGIDLPFRREGDTLRVTVPRLEVHSVLVAE